MKVNRLDDSIIVFLNNFFINDINYRDNKDLEKLLKIVIDKLKNYYDINVIGYYNVLVYIDKNYGLILEMIDENLEYMDCDEIIDARLKVINTNFLYKINDLINYSFEHKTYLYQDEIYIDILEDIDYIELGILLENSEIIYKNTQDIIKYGKVLKI